MSNCELLVELISMKNLFQRKYLVDYENELEKCEKNKLEN